MKIYVPIKAIVDSLYIAVDNYSRKPYLVFYIKASDSVPFICDDYWFWFKTIDKNVENYNFYLFTTELFNRLLAYIKDVEDVNVGLGRFLNYFSRFANLAGVRSISYKDLKNYNPKYQKAFWYAISNSFAPNFVWSDLRKFLECFLLDLAHNPNVQEYVYDIGKLERPFLFKANPVLRYIGIADRLKHYISHLDTFIVLFIVIYLLIILVL